MSLTCSASDFARGSPANVRDGFRVLGCAALDLLTAEIQPELM
jgi:hypothetical protein